MKFDLKKLKSQGKYVFPFTCSFEPDVAILDYPSAYFDGQATVSGTLDIMDTSVYVDAEITVTVKGECSRCLSDATVTVSALLQEEFTENGREEDGYTYSRGQLDLTAAATEMLSLAMPVQILCKQDCKGLCPSCGANLNETQCNCRNLG